MASLGATASGTRATGGHGDSFPREPIRLQGNRLSGDCPDTAVAGEVPGHASVPKSLRQSSSRSLPYKGEWEGFTVNPDPGLVPVAREVEAVAARSEEPAILATSSFFSGCPLCQHG